MPTSWTGSARRRGPDAPGALYGSAGPGIEVAVAAERLVGADTGSFQRPSGLRSPRPHCVYPFNSKDKHMDYRALLTMPLAALPLAMSAGGAEKLR